MNNWARWVVYLALWAGVFVVATPAAEAQIAPGGGGMGPGMGGPSQPSGDEKKEGIAEAAPKAPGLLPTTPALPAPKGRRKRWKLFELDGYYRMRTDWLRNFNEGFPQPGFGGTPFPTALGCKSMTLGHPCDDSLSSANMRLRLEPTINLDEGTSVHIQADLLDNLIFGSTPLGESLAGVYPSTPVAVNPPVGAFGNGTQASVIQGVNSNVPAVQIKRAWGEVALPLGVLKFGRMPNHWGMGILYNGGGADPINGGYDYDADTGDSVDRVSFSALIPGTNLRAMVASDWSMTRLASNQTSANTGHEAHPFDLDDSDDMNGWVGVLSRMDSPQEFKDTLDRGELALNYGVYFEYKTQSWDYNLQDFTLGGTTDLGGTNLSPHYVPRGLKTYSPDLWGKIGFGRLTAEAELAAQFGSIEHLDDYGHAGSADIRKIGGAGRLTYKGLEGKFRMGVEGGFASGDHLSDPTNPGVINLAFADPLRGIADDSRLTQFAFNSAYHVDMILWRTLIGAVSNAAYVKPFLQYDVTKSITFKVANITSFALRTASTPGHDSLYGTEFNAEIGYTSGGLFIGVAYGVLFPFAALAHPADIPTLDGTTQKFGFTDPNNPTDLSNVKDADTSHTIQSRIVLAF